jgi:hypothetical protein
MWNQTNTLYHCIFQLQMVVFSLWNQGMYVFPFSAATSTVFPLYLSFPDMCSSSFAVQALTYDFEPL